MILFAIKTATCSCSFEARKYGFKKEKFKVHKIGKLPKSMPENSGLSRAEKAGFYWTHNDSGGQNQVFKISENGQKMDSLGHPQLRNIDWEDIATDENQNIFIGDIGNNSNKRKNLKIYALEKNESLDSIRFQYADQNFDVLEKREFDAEAFFYANDSLYLFTKSWEKGLKKTKLYTMPRQAGNYILAPKAQMMLKAQITGADISPDASKFALISYGKILIFEIEDKKINFDAPLCCIKAARGQTEAIAFRDNKSIIFSNENRKIYTLNFE